MAHGAATGINLFWGARGASLQFAATCREQISIPKSLRERTSIRVQGPNSAG
jgi:hypothetical protein